MKNVTLIRLRSDESQTLGTLFASNGNAVFVCKTLELAWKDNQIGISCIPAGVYECVYTRSNVLSRKAGKDVFTYELVDVPKRAGIRIHPANYFYELRGCIAIGAAHKDLNRDMQLDLVHSGNTVKEFERFMNYEPFRLEIIRWDKALRIGRLRAFV